VLAVTKINQLSGCRNTRGVHFRYRHDLPGVDPCYGSYVKIPRKLPRVDGTDAAVRAHGQP